jgi:hypothetical protein
MVERAPTGEPNSFGSMSPFGKRRGSAMKATTHNESTTLDTGDF